MSYQLLLYNDINQPQVDMCPFPADEFDVFVS